MKTYSKYRFLGLHIELRGEVIPSADASVGILSVLINESLCIPVTEVKTRYLEIAWDRLNDAAYKFVSIGVVRID